MPTDICPTCGRNRDLHDRHVRFTLPDPVLNTDEREAAAGTWLSHGNARDSVMIYVPAVGGFVRALLPIRLLGTPVETAVRNPDETPYCDRSDDPDLERVLRDEWPHDVLPDVA